MERSILGFRTDEEGHWVALLDCGHPQHVRHDPPMVERPWVTTAEGRASRIGVRLDCVRCDRFEMPAGAVCHRETAELTESTVPSALLRDHTTKPGVWARIVVREGTLRYHVDRLGVHADVTPDAPAIVIPEVPHRVEPLGAVRFHVELYRVAARSEEP